MTMIGKRVKIINPNEQVFKPFAGEDNQTILREAGARQHQILFCKKYHRYMDRKQEGEIIFEYNHPCWGICYVIRFYDNLVRYTAATRLAWAELSEEDLTVKEDTQPKKDTTKCTWENGWLL